MTSVVDNKVHQQLSKKQMEALGQMLLDADEGDVIVTHFRNCLVSLGGGCNCTPRIFVVPFTKGYVS